MDFNLMGQCRPRIRLKPVAVGRWALCVITVYNLTAEKVSRKMFENMYYQFLQILTKSKTREAGY